MSMSMSMKDTDIVVRTVPLGALYRPAGATEFMPCKVLESWGPDEDGRWGIVLDPIDEVAAAKEES